MSYFRFSSPKWSLNDYLASNFPLASAYRPFSEKQYSAESVSSSPTYLRILLRSEPPTIPKWMPLARIVANVSIMSASIVLPAKAKV